MDGIYCNTYSVGKSSFLSESRRRRNRYRKKAANVSSVRVLSYFPHTFGSMMKGFSTIIPSSARLSRVQRIYRSLFISLGAHIFSVIRLHAIPFRLYTSFACQFHRFIASISQCSFPRHFSLVFRARLGWISKRAAAKLNLY